MVSPRSRMVTTAMTSPFPVAVLGPVAGRQPPGPTGGGLAGHRLRRAPGGPADDLEQELEDLDVPPGGRQVLAPSVEAVPADEEGVQAPVDPEHGLEGGAASGPVAGVGDDRDPLAVLMSRHAFE